MSDLDNVALDILKQGFPVFPVRPLGKTPLVPWKPYQENLPSEAQVGHWWRKWPNANIGMATGHLSRLLVIDVDSSEALNVLLKTCPTITRTAQAQTGRGWHFYFQWEAGIPNGTDRLAPGIDVRSEGGFVLLPPSIHKSGRRYEWLNDRDPLPLPVALKKALSGLHKEPVNSLSGEQASARIRQGQRNQSLTSLGGTMRKRGMSGEAIEAALIAENKVRCDPPLPDVEVKGIAESVARYAANFTSDLKQTPSEAKFNREINLGTLQAKAIEGDGPSLECLPVLGQEKFIFKQFSHIVSAYPKAGKTELLVRAIAEWPDERVLYFTEEPEAVWQARLRELPKGYNHVNLYFGLGTSEQEIKGRILSGDETVVILDTVRTLLGVRDENDNSEIARRLIPYIAASREKGHTLITVHHERKGAGEHGEAIAGGGAFLGIFDRAIELKRDGKIENRRVLRGYGRVVESQELVYELKDGQLIPLGSPSEVTLQAVKDRVLKVLDGELETTKVLRNEIGAPRPSIDQMANALEELAREGKAERDPPLAEGKRQGATYKWTLSRSSGSDDTGS